MPFIPPARQHAVTATSSTHVVYSAGKVVAVMAYRGRMVRSAIQVGCKKRRRDEREDSWNMLC